MLEYAFQDAVQGELESDLQRHVDQVVELLVKSHHTLEATQLLCLDSLSSNSDLFATLVEFTPRWMESLQNVSSSSWSSDPAPVSLSRVEFWIVSGSSLLIYLGSCLLCVTIGFGMGRRVERPEVFLPSGR